MKFADKRESWRGFCEVETLMNSFTRDKTSVPSHKTWQRSWITIFFNVLFQDSSGKLNIFRVDFIQTSNVLTTRTSSYTPKIFLIVLSPLFILPNPFLLMLNLCMFTFCIGLLNERAEQALSSNLGITILSWCDHDSDQTL